MPEVQTCVRCQDRLERLNNYVPMDGKIKRIINAFVVIVIVIWLLQAFCLLGSLQNIRIR